MSAEKEPLYSVITIYPGGRFIQTQFEENEYDKMIDFIKGCQGSETEYSVFKGEDLYDVETGRTWNPLKEFIAKRKNRR